MGHGKFLALDLPSGTLSSRSLWPSLVASRPLTSTGISPSHSPYALSLMSLSIGALGMKD